MRCRCWRPVFWSFGQGARARGALAVAAVAVALMMLSTVLSWWLLAAPSQAAGTGTNLALSLSPNPIHADGISTTTATATVTDINGAGVPSDAITISTNGGQTFTTPASGTTDASGNFSATMKSTTTLGPSTISAADSSSPLILLPAQATLIQTPPPPPPAPTNITPPTISGIPQQGQTLTETNGTWTNNPTSFSYQWERCIGSSANCPGISGATTQSYTLTPGDVGFRIRVVETATNANPVAGTANSARTAVVTPLAPTNTSPPTITGSPAPGQTLTAASGAWANSPTSFSYQWDDCDSSGSNCFPSPTTSNQPTYVVTGLDLNHTIRVVQTAANAGGSASATSTQTGVVVLNSSTTSLSAQPNAAVTNAGVKLTATITASSSAASPAGTITFYNGSRAIAACTNDLVAGSGQTVIATCTTSFAASTSPEALGAVFTAANGSSVAGSQSAPVSVSVGRDSTSTALDVSNLTIKTGSSTTFTATVSPGHAGSMRPSGVVEFLDGGKPIAFCLRQPLGGSTASSATCIVKYKKKGKHRITAVYGGDANFTGSPLSPALAVSVRKLRTGTITSTMQWTFFFTPAYTKVLTLVVNGPPFGGTVLVKCHGQGCPFAKRATPVATFKTCIGKGKPRCSVRKARTVNLMQGFRKHRLHVGTQITVELLRPNFIGKNYQFQVRAGNAPRIQIRCLAPGKTRPGVGC